MNKKPKSKKRWIFLGLFVVITGVLIALGMRDSAPVIEITAGEVDQGDITSTVTGTGRIQPTVQVSISSEVAGEIIELPLKDGDPVKKGDLLVRVNPDTLFAQVKQQEASLSSTRANSAENKAQLVQSERELRRQQGLFEKGFATEDQLDQARTQAEVSKARYESSLHQIERQEMQLKEASDALAKASTYSPIDGTVVKLNSENGDRVVGTGQFEGTEIMRVANLDAMEVRVDVSEVEIVHIKIGQEASVEIDALPDETFEARVTEIANSALTTGNRSQDELTTFQVKIELNAPDPRLRPGMSANADVKTKTVKDTLKVPLQSVVVRPAEDFPGKEKPEEKSEESVAKKSPEGEKKKKSWGDRKDKGDDRLRAVFVVKDDGTVSIRKVKTGIADNRDIEILSGVKVDEKIVTGSYRALTRELKDGTKVEVKENGRSDKSGKS